MYFPRPPSAGSRRFSIPVAVRLGLFGPGIAGLPALSTSVEVAQQSRPQSVESAKEYSHSVTPVLPHNPRRCGILAARTPRTGIAVAWVVAAPKQSYRTGDGSALSRLGAHLAGSLPTALPVARGWAWWVWRSR